MKTLEELRGRITSVEEMQSIVSTMKSLSAARIRQYESAANATIAYSQTVQLAFQILIQSHKAIPLKAGGQVDDRRHAMVLFGSDQGFCGRINEEVLQSATQFISEIGPSEKRNYPIVIVVGTRLEQLLSAAGVQVEHSFRLPNSVAKITESIQRVIVQIQRCQQKFDIDHIGLFFNQRTSASTFSANQSQLLPIADEYLEELGSKPWNSRSRPVYPIGWQELFSVVVQQHLFLQLFRACAESLASENASRIAAMQQAESNIQQRLSNLNSEFNQSRQTAITEELLDIITGFEASDE
jgi:F-type H+-transporting ATPase subunit gamma